MKKIALLCLFPALAVAEHFVPPAEGPVAFRRDRLLLDADTMAHLSGDLVHLAAAIPGKTPEQRHHAARIIALALGLDPANESARHLLDAFTNNRHEIQPDSDEPEKSRTRIWQTLAWLETPEAKADGHALAACLADILVFADPEHPRVDLLRAAGEKGAWNGWVPPPAAYRKPEPIPQPKPEPPPVEEEKSAILLAEAEVQALLWTQNSDELWRRKPLSVKMEASKFQLTKESPSRKFRLSLGRTEMTPPLQNMLVSTERALIRHHGELPEQVQVTFRSEELSASLRSGRFQDISAAAFVLVSAALDGEEPGAIIFGTFSENGDLGLPGNFWDQLRALADDPEGGGRLVLPAAAASYLPSLLALEKPEFFLRYQVILAANTEELLRFSRKSPASSELGPLSRFSEIQAKSGNQPAGQYVALYPVRQRLAEIRAEAPWHASARMLSMQAAGERPTRLPRSILARELQIAIQRIPQITRNSYPQPSQAYIQGVEEIQIQVRQSVTELERYVDTPDRELHAKTRDLMNLIRPLLRACNKARNNSEEIYLVHSAVADIDQAYKSTRAILSAAANGE